MQGSNPLSPGRGPGDGYNAERGASAAAAQTSPFGFSRNRKRAAVTSTGWLGSATLSGESPLLLCSFALSNVPALLSLAPGGQQYLNFFCRELLLIFRQMGIKVIPRLRAACPNVHSRLSPTRIV